MQQIIDTPEGIKAFRIIALKHALKLECIGLKGRFNAYAIVKREFGFKGNRQSVLEQLTQWIEKNLMQNS